MSHISPKRPSNSTVIFDIIAIIYPPILDMAKNKMHLVSKYLKLWDINAN